MGCWHKQHTAVTDAEGGLCFYALYDTVVQASALCVHHAGPLLHCYPGRMAYKVVDTGCMPISNTLMSIESHSIDSFEQQILHRFIGFISFISLRTYEKHKPDLSSQCRIAVRIDPM